MKLIKKKTRKALEKTLRKAIKKHAPAIAAGLASGLASSLATLAGTEASDGKGQSNLSKIAEKVQEALGQQPDAESRKHKHHKHHAEKKTRRPSDSPPPMSTERTPGSRLPA